jgi:uncharacterized protein YndB with AHSA1/START domain
MRALRWVLYVAAGLAVLLLAAFAIGATLPIGHQAAVRAVYAQPPERVYDALADVQASPAWRTGVDSVRVIGDPDAGFSWIEYSSFGATTLVREHAERPRLLTGRIADESQGFGGTWTFELVPAAAGTELTITERGRVFSPLFRFMSKYVFGHHRTLESYARDLGRHFGEDVSVHRYPVANTAPDTAAASLSR